MKPFCGTRETIQKQTGIKPAANKRRRCRLEAQTNHSIHSADRTTHLKIVVVALVAGIVVAVLGIAGRSTDYAQTAHVIKAGKPTMVTNSDAVQIR